MKCARHSDTETSLTCGRCETPICVRCLVQTDVGIRCRTCAPVRRGVPGFGSNRFRNAAIVVGIVFVGVLLIGGGSRLGGGSAGPGDYNEYANEILEQYQPEVTATRFIDPWLPASPTDSSPSGRRLVALEVTIEYPKGRDATHFVSASYFKLIDRDDFVYSTRPSLIDPSVPEGLELTPRQKTRGWVMFEIDEQLEIKSIAYGLAELALPEAETNAVAGE